MTFLGFDPGAELRIDGVPQFVEATLVRNDDGKLDVICEDEHGAWCVRLTLRSDFLDALIAVRKREAAA